MKKVITSNNTYFCEESRKSCISTVTVRTEVAIDNFKERNLDSDDESSTFVHFIDSYNLKISFGAGSLQQRIESVDQIIYKKDEKGNLIVYPKIKYPHGYCRDCSKEITWIYWYCKDCSEKAKEERGTRHLR